VGLTASVSTQLGRAQAFLGDVDAGLKTLHAASTTLTDIDSHYESLDARARVAEVLVFAGRFPEARTTLAQLRQLERDFTDSPVAALIDRVELSLEVSSGKTAIDASEFDRFLERARDVSATYDELIILELMERSGDRTHHDEIVRLTQDLGVVTLPMLAAVAAPVFT
jgi:hypothetical protein